MAASLDDLTAKVEEGEPLSDAGRGGARAERDIIALGMLATTVRRKLHGDDVTFVRVADLKVPTRSAGSGLLDVVPTFRRSAADPPAKSGSFRRRTPRRRGRGRDRRASWPATPLSAFCLFELGKLPEGLPVVLAR